MNTTLRIPALLLTFLTVGSLAAQTQTDPVAVLEYYDDPAEIQVLDEDGFEVNPYLGIALNPGDVVITNQSSAEIRLDPNGSIMRLDAGTRFTVEGIQGRAGATANSFAMERGRMRMVASRLTGRDASYTIRTPTAVAGVRGTDFGITARPEAEGTPPVEELFVFSGEVAFESGLSGESVNVGASQRANVFGETFAPVVMSQEELNQRRSGLDFVQLNPAEVPQVGEDDGEAEPEEDEDSGEEAVQEEIPVADEDAGGDEEGLGDRLFGTLARITGLQVGSITINEQTWAQAVLQPRISLGRLSLDLYLPITYQDNLFDGSQWYRPEGNNEWSFGTDQDWSGDPAGALQDLGTDLALKIRAMEFGDRGDPFFLKVGNLSNFTVGQGLLMRNYANDVDFPSVRRIGFNLGFDLEQWGLETVVDDLAGPKVYAGRIFFRPAAPAVPAAVGISAVTDIGPAREISTTRDDGSSLPADQAAPLDAARGGDPQFVNVAMDLELPVINRDLLAVIGFAEGGGLIPYLREDTSLNGETVTAGLKTDALVDFSTGDLKNFGWTAGVRGNLSFLDYRLEYRSFDGIFRPAFYGPSYERLRGRYAAETVAYLADTEAERYQVRTMGIAGELGASIFGLIDLSAGYFWPWEVTESGSVQGSDQDNFLLTLALRDGLLPFGIQTGFEYERTSFAATIAGWGEFSDATLFDANTSVDGFVAYPFNETVRIVARVSTAVVRDESGEVVYDNNGQPRVAPTVGIQTELGF